MMLVYRLSYQEPMPPFDALQPRKVMAIGDFDGVHLGHREVIRRAVADAESLRAPAAVMTFDPHPREVLGIAKYAYSLTPLERKLELLEQLGVDIAYVVSFDEQLMRVTPEQFIERVLLPLGLDTAIVGFDFTFGHRGLGTPDSLAQLSKGAFAVEVIRPFEIEGSKVSSTAIREALERGDVAEAHKLLGRPYAVRGTVVHGDARGRTIGFPTANIEPEGLYVLPANGVYAIRAELDGERYDGVMNVGVKPTFASGGVPVPTLEAHLFEFNRDIYGAVLEVQLISRLRSERKFGSVQELVEQIRRDAEEAKAHLLSF
ncbi:bifunctional riboflavin kinase/FAD synthetase [Paenibacillus chartarius]|uniref:Riboflavin biosynthesis protein n=1 Tax=Paenibacillus chartarius TaxID=747481 RepID=A0ABV6DSS3_9BACL